MDNTDKTIPYRLSPAELESLRLLRKRTKPSNSVQDGEEEEEMAEEINVWNSDLEPINQIVKKKIP